MQDFSRFFFTSGFSSPAFLEHSSTVNAYHNPTVQIFDPMPYGFPVENNNPQLEDLQTLFGYAKIDFQVLEYHYHPVCTLKKGPSEGKPSITSSILIGIKAA